MHNTWNLIQFTRTGCLEDRYVVPFPFRTPLQYNHCYGDFELFWQESKDRFIGFIKIPKNMSSVTKSALAKHEDFRAIDNQFVENLQHIDLQDIQFFAITRDDDERLLSGFREWKLVNPDYHAGPRLTGKPMPHSERQKVTLEEILERPEIWDEHMEPQQSFLAPFQKHNLSVKMFELSEALMTEAEEYFGVNIYKNLVWGVKELNEIT
jgi:hypothetical protein